MPGRIFVARESFSTRWEGRPLVVQAGCTFREGHPMLDAYPGLFKLLVPTYEHTPPPKPAEAKPAPAPKPAVTLPPRPAVKAVAAKPAAAEVKANDKKE